MVIFSVPSLILILSIYINCAEYTRIVYAKSKVLVLINIYSVKFSLRDRQDNCDSIRRLLSQ